MPHLVLNGTVDVQRLAAELQPAVVRWGRAVLKTGGVWLHAKDETALVEGVVVETPLSVLVLDLAWTMTVS